MDDHRQKTTPAEGDNRHRETEWPWKKITAFALVAVIVVTVPLWLPLAVLLAWGVWHSLDTGPSFEQQQQVEAESEARWDNYAGEYGKTDLSATFLTVTIDELNQSTIDAVVAATGEFRAADENAGTRDLVVKTADGTYRAESDLVDKGNVPITDSVGAAQTLIDAGGTVNLTAYRVTVTGEPDPVRAFLADPGYDPGWVEYYPSPEMMELEESSITYDLAAVVGAPIDRFDEGLAFNEEAMAVVVGLGYDTLDDPRVKLSSKNPELMLRSEQTTGDCAPLGEPDAAEKIADGLAETYGTVEVGIRCANKDRPKNY